VSRAPKFVAMASINIVAVVASPHQSGSTASAVQTVLEGAASSGATTTCLDLSRDAAEVVVDAIEAAQGVVFASPVYRAGHTSMLAQLLEQIERGAPGEARAPLRGKAVAIVLTGASEHHFLTTERLRGTIASFFAAQTLSPALYLTPNSYAADKSLAEGAREQALLHGRALVELATCVTSGAALKQLAPLA
jgi:FMN reductase